MEKPSFLVSWSSSEKEELSLKLIQLSFKPVTCSAWGSQALVLSDETKVFNLNPLAQINTQFSIACLACNEEVVLMLTVEGVTLVMGTDKEGSGLLGLPETNTLQHPTPIASLTGVFSIYCGLGKTHGAIVDNTGKLYTWGKNDFNQCGKDLSTPSEVLAASYFSITKLHCGEYSTGFITSGGHLYTFGLIGQLPTCMPGSSRPKDPFILPDLEYHYIKEFCIGKGFVVVLTEAGQVLLYDDCRVLIKVPLNSEVKSVACSREAVYCTEKKSFVTYEWKFGKEKVQDECGLRNLAGKAYKIGPAKIFSSGSEEMFALVSQETAGKFLFNVNHELTWTVPSKASVSPVHSPNVKRTSFRALSKEFSLNIDHYFVIKNDAALKIGEILKKWVQGSFKSLWESTFQQDLFRKSLEQNKRFSLVWVVKKVILRKLDESLASIKGFKRAIKIQEVFKDTFAEFSEHYKTLKAFCRCLEKVSKKKVFLLLRPSFKKHQAYIIRICVVSIEKVFQKQKAQIFTLLIRECLSSRQQKTLAASLTGRLVSLTEKFESSSSKVHENSNKLMHFGLIVQSIFEKTRTFHTLRGFRAFKSTFRNTSCFTPSLTYIKPDKTFSESFDKNFNLSNYFKSEQKPRAKNYSIELPKKKNEKNATNNDRRHSLFSGSGKKDIPVSKDIRKAYDNQLKNARKNSFLEKTKNGRLEQRRKERLYKIACALLKVEIKAVKMVKRKKVLGFNTIVMAQAEKVVVIEQWRTKVFALGFHKLSWSIKKLMKIRFEALKKIT